MNLKIVLDTDILSMFAKIDAIDLLKQLFGEKVIITPKIRDELSVPLEYGYKFPLKIISEIKTVPLNDQALKKYLTLQGNFSLGKGELEAIAYCLTEKCLFATNDLKARELARKEGLSVISLQAILKALWKNNVMSKRETRNLLKRMQYADNLVITRKVEKEIFDE